MTSGPEGASGARGRAAAREAARAFTPSADHDPLLAEALDQGEPSEPVRVERIDRPGSAYYLVPFYAAGALRAIVEVDAEGYEVSKAGAVRGENIAFLIPPERALEAARELLPSTRDLEEPRLGWQPCRESFDSFQPFWVIGHSGDRIYVDQSGRAHERLSTEGLGGAGDGPT